VVTPDEMRMKKIRRQKSKRGRRAKLKYGSPDSFENGKGHRA